MKIARLLLLAFLSIFALGGIPSATTCFFMYSAQKLFMQKKKPSLFVPTFKNLNVITMNNFSQQKPENGDEISISQLTNLIYKNYDSINDGTLLPIKSYDSSVKGYYSLYKGINISEDDQYITIYSRGFARESKPSESNESYYKKILNFIIPGFQVRGMPKKGGGALCAYASIRENIIHTPCVSFDYPDTLSLLNIAQTVDLQCLGTVTQGIPSTLKRIDVGTSRGATALLKAELLNKTDNHPVAMVLESPILCLDDTISQLIKTSLWNMPAPSSLAYSVFTWLCPSYNSREDNVTKLLPNITKDIPIFIVHLNNDPYVSNEAMFCIVKNLRQKNKNIYLLVLDDQTKQARHGRLNIMKPFQRALNAFYKNYKLPHNAQLAEEEVSQKLFTNARTNTTASSVKNWIITDCGLATSR